MATYLTNTEVFLDLPPGGPRMVKKGEKVAYAGWPGSNLTAVDEDAQEVKAYYDECRARGKRLPENPASWRAGDPARLLAGDELSQARARIAELEDALANRPVEIPEKWLEMRPEQIINLSRRLGASPRCNYTSAIAHIEREIAKRSEDSEGVAA